MFNSQVLEIAIGLVFVFLIASLLASVVREFVESVLKTRAVQLERGLRLLLDDPTGKQTTAKLFAHPQVFALFEGVYDPNKLTGFFQGWKKSETHVNGELVLGKALRLPLGSCLPSYIPSRNFALALLDMLDRHGTAAPGIVATGPGGSMETLLAHANALAPSRLRDALLVAINEAQGDFDRARMSLEAWFDSNMDRVSGWYKRESQVVLLIIGLVVAFTLNIDTIAITRELAANNTVRAQIVLKAEELANQIGTDPATRSLGNSMHDPEALRQARTGLGKLIGQPKNFNNWTSNLWMIVGWLMTAIAISFGAPFWFDLLNKMMVVRSTVKPFEKSPSEGSEDRSGGTPSAEKLEPQAVASGAAGAGAGPATVSTSGGTPTGSVRLAVASAGLTEVTLTIDGQPAALPSNGLVDLPLTLGPDHHLELNAKNAGGDTLSWSQLVRVTLDNDALAIDAELA